MNIYLIIITIISVISAIINIKNKKIKLSLLQIILSISNPIIIEMFCQKKYRFVFGGTDLEFLIQTALIDGLIEPWLILLINIVLIILIFICILKVQKNERKVPNE